MTQPVPYTPTTDFSQEEAGGVSGRAPSRTAAMDVEFDNLAATLSQVLTNLAILQRDDTELSDGIVKGHTLSASVLAMIGSATGSRWVPRGVWLTATAYVAYDFVENAGGSYLCLVPHTSGVFATDHAAGKWMAISPDVAVFAAQVAAYQADMASTSDVAKGDALLGVKKTAANSVGTTQHEVNERTISAFDFMSTAQIADVIARTRLVDVSVPLQNFLNATVQGQRTGVMPAGDYFCATPPTVGTGTASQYMGVSVEGSGYGGTSGGTRIVIDGTGHTACMTVKKDAYRGLTLKNFTLECSTDAATYGILYDSSEISQPKCESVFISGPTRAIGFLKGTGSNGEFPSFTNVRANNINQFFYSDAGQAFMAYFEGGWANLRGVTPIVFNFDTPTTQGGGLVANGFSASGTAGANGVSNTTLIKMRGNRSSTYTFIGGRYEMITCILDRDNVADNGLAAMTCQFVGVEMSIDNRKAHVDNVLNGIVKLQSTGGNGMPDQVAFEECRFQAVSGSGTDIVFDVSHTLSYRGHAAFKKCFFIEFAQPPYVKGTWNSDAVVEWIDCKAPMVSDTEAVTATRTPIAFSKRWGGDKFATAAIGNRAVHALSAPLSNGKAINHLQVPQFREATGSVNNTAADAPWVHGGATSTFQFIRDWSSNGTPGDGPNSPSPWSKHVRLELASHVYQDISSINLNTTNYTTGGRSGQFVCYQALLNRFIGSTGNLRITLENSSSGKIYDQIDLNAGVTSVSPCLVTLCATIAATASGSLRLKFEETGGVGDVQLDFAWQYITTDPHSVFVGASTAAVTGSVPWSAVGESLRLYSRLALPYKIDDYGSRASPAHTDLESDLYLSKSTELATYYANAGWNRVPQSRLNTTAVGNVGGGTDDLMSATIAARTLFENGHTIVIDAYGRTANNSNPKTIALLFGATTIVSQALTVSQVGKWHIRAEITRTGASTQDWVVHLTQSGTAAIHTVDMGTAAITDTAAIIVKCTGVVTDGGGGINNDDIVQEFMRVQYAK